MMTQWGNFMCKEINKDKLLFYLEGIKDNLDRRSIKQLPKSEKNMNRGSKVFLDRLIEDIRNGKFDTEE